MIILATNNFGDTREGSLAGPMGLVPEWGLRMARRAEADDNVLGFG